MGLKELFKGKPERSVLEKATFCMCPNKEIGEIETRNILTGEIVNLGNGGEILQRAVYRVDSDRGIIRTGKNRK